MQFYEPFKSIYQLPNSEPLRGQQLGRAKSANSLITISYEDVVGLLVPLLGNTQLTKKAILPQEVAFFAALNITPN
jgi:hypothetical protein